MTLRRAFQVGAVVWAAVGLAVALPSVGSADPGARVVVGVLSVLLPLMAALAAAALARGRDRLAGLPRGRDRLAGLLLLLSVATPTYFFWVVNLPALVVGCGLVIRGLRSPRKVRGPSRSGSSGPAS